MVLLEWVTVQVGVGVGVFIAVSFHVGARPNLESFYVAAGGKASSLRLLTVVQDTLFHFLFVLISVNAKFNFYLCVFEVNGFWAYVFFGMLGLN